MNLFYSKSTPALLTAFLLCTTLSSLALAQEETVSPPIPMNAGSDLAPAGMTLQIKFMTALNASSSHVGDVFIARAAQDLMVGDQLLIPRGTAIRGRVAFVQRPGYFSKGGLLRLTFDHILLPTGEAEPVALQIDSSTKLLSASKNGLYADPGVGAKLNDSVSKGVAQYKSFHDKGVAEGEKRGGGINMLLTVPVDSVAGAVVGTGTTTYQAAKSLVGKGQTVFIRPGDVIAIRLVKPTILEAH